MHIGTPVATDSFALFGGLFHACYMNSEAPLTMLVRVSWLTKPIIALGEFFVGARNGFSTRLL